MVEVNFGIGLSETPQNGLVLLPFFYNHTFTIVEENFEIGISETPQNGSILLPFFHNHIFTNMVEENFEI